MSEMPELASAFEGLDPREETIAMWAVMPKGERPSAAMLATQLQVNDATIYKILAKPHVREAVMEARRFLLNSQALGDFWVHMLDLGQKDEDLGFKLAKILLDAGVHPFGAEAAAGSQITRSLNGQPGTYERVILERGKSR